MLIVERNMEIENQYLANITVVIVFKQGSPIDGTLCGPKSDEKQGICIVSEYFPIGCLLTTKGKVVVLW